VADLFREWLAERHPGKAARVMRAVRDLHGGRDYDPSWGTRMKGTGKMADLIGRRFALARERLGLDQRMPELRCDLFRVPGRAEQLELF
jgi:DNA repair photolyase